MRFRSGCDIVKGDERGPGVHVQSVHFKGRHPVTWEAQSAAERGIG